MAIIKEKLANSLGRLKAYQDKNKHSILKGQKVLGETHTKRLPQNGYLEQIIRDLVWSLPGQSS